jgi:hypothetical protein
VPTDIETTMLDRHLAVHSHSDDATHAKRQSGRFLNEVIVSKSVFRTGSNEQSF